MSNEAGDHKALFLSSKKIIKICRARRSQIEQGVGNLFDSIFESQFSSSGLFRETMFPKTCSWCQISLGHSEENMGGHILVSNYLFDDET